MKTEYFGIDDSGVLHNLGEWDCWDDMDYEGIPDHYSWIWTRESFTHFLSYGVMLLGSKEEGDANNELFRNGKIDD